MGHMAVGVEVHSVTIAGQADVEWQSFTCFVGFRKGDGTVFDSGAEVGEHKMAGIAC